MTERNESDFSAHHGKTIVWVTRFDDDVLCIYFTDYTFVRLRVKGECCSTSWIEHFEMPNDIIGATVLSYREFDKDVFTCNGEDDYLQTYEVRIGTSAGDIVMEHRNASNGYYGGEVYITDDFWAGNNPIFGVINQ